jgi:hypothetical protein
MVFDPGFVLTCECGYPTISLMEDTELERHLKDILKRLEVRIRMEPLEEGIGGFCRLEKEPLVVLSKTSTRKQRIDVMLGALRRIDSGGIYIPPSIRDLLEENRNEPTLYQRHGDQKPDM